MHPSIQPGCVDNTSGTYEVKHFYFYFFSYFLSAANETGINKIKYKTKTMSLNDNLFLFIIIQHVIHNQENWPFQDIRTSVYSVKFY